METLWQDVRFGMRMILKSPSIAMVAVVTLAVGIGANTAIFSVVDGVLLRPLPYDEADRLVMLWEHSRAGGKPRNVISPANYLDWRDRSRSFESSALLLDVRRSLTGGSEPEEIAVQGVTIDFFPMLGTTPLIGRDFAPEDATPDAPGAVLISHGLWKRRFGLDPGVIGSSIPLGGRPYEIIGVMPPRAGLFVPEGSLTGARPECWMPLGLTERSRIRQGRFAMAVARLAPGVTLESAQSELDSIASRLEQENVEFNTGWGVNVVPLKDQLVGEIRPALLVLLGAVGFVLLAACANVGSLMLARMSQREREVAIRAALGAGRRRIVRQLLTECVLLACMGGIGGVLLAWWGLDLLLALAPQDALPDSPLGLDLRVLVFALGAAGLSGVLFGVLPAWLGARSDLHTALKDGGRSASSGPRRRRAQGAFVVTQVALALVLLVGSGLLIRSFGRLAGVDPGFDARAILTLRLQLPGAKYGEDHQRVAFFSELTRRVAALPGVRSVGINTFAPFTGSGSATTCVVDGRPLPPPGESPVCDVRMVDSGF
ncbi:MAG TPA: ABC transporter permease, partial [Candidatus Polarisedimenticolia bacterium]|nr:ABC transporter permease [Candidatus Polarisedimenticolia bacterium]